METERFDLSLQEFYDVLKSHDWTYEYSDDHRVWKQGLAEAGYIRQVMNIDRPDNFKYRELYNQFYDYVFKKASLPARPE